MHKAETTVPDIARTIGRSYNCVRNYLEKKGPYKPCGGPSPKLKEREKRQNILTTSTYGSNLLRKTTCTLALNVSKETVGKFIRGEG